jgi:pimeloyl-ACP methyl ester carboxylesterase
VPTLILTPSYDTLIGEHAAQQMLEGIPGATEIVLQNTGHMFRFSHPVTYANAIKQFLQERVAHEKPHLRTTKNTLHAQPVVA